MKKLLSSLNYAVLGLGVLSMMFVTFEPAISLGATSDQRQFTISQTVSKEVAFSTSPSNVTMSPSLGGLTGGTSTGETQFVVTTNSLTGYSVTIIASSTTGAMQGTASTTNYIPGYTATSPDYDMTVAANKAAFAYTIQSSSTADVTQMFRNSGSTCNSGTDHAIASFYHCWIQATSTAVTIINRSLPTTVPATSTIAFMVKINSNPNPIIPNDTYIATTTLTATVN